MQPLYVLIPVNMKFLWNNELQALFQPIKTYITKDVTLTLPSKNHPFFITVDSHLVGEDCVLFQMNNKDQNFTPFSNF